MATDHKTGEIKLHRQHLYSVRPGLSSIQLRLTIGASGAIGSDGYGNTKAADDVVRVSGEEAHSDANQHVKGLVKPNEWTASPDDVTAIAPVTRTGTGAYTIRLDDEYLGCSGFKWAHEHASDTNYYGVTLVSFTATDSNNKARSSFKIQVVDNSNDAADLSSGTELWLELMLKTSEQG